MPLLSWYLPRPILSLWDSPYIAVPLWSLTLVGLAIPAFLIVWPWDHWIGAFCLWSCLTSAWSAPESVGPVAWIVLGGVITASIARLGPLTLGTLLTVCGLIQVAVICSQRLGWYLPIGVWAMPDQGLHGTYGSPRYAAMALAMIAPLAPWWALPAIFLSLVWLKSYMAIVAAGIALVVRWPKAWPCIPLGLGLIYLTRGVSYDSGQSRLFIQAAAVHDWWHGSLWTKIAGRGFGAWLQRMVGVTYHGEGYLALYNDYLQLLYESGLVGLAFLGGFFVTHWRWFQREPALIAVAILAAVWFPFHLASVAVVALAIIGRASCTNSPHGRSSTLRSRSSASVADAIGA